ncbi:hypothetical protein SAMN04487980_103179 [Streptomyces sp. cf124]|nr:hypothetical protein [Streptomyces caniscabiei]SFN77353.1 hypothetical protein SAMN04487980_103179 [Streptomyces sp. cf124]MBE4738974.1 hypothetical protein [Streptomyces caniscabiei]MBE4757886.1 hypothetical protein [Streptomyces caniscabiei]MBE4787547.1 hypothetical protein [Streptomyces caniscabiei]MBE4794262.1 hypothetical protein [Streptomyces caniscabiei]
MPGPTVPDTGSSTILPAVEQRIGSNNQPLAAAAVDPSHIPGLTAPVSVKKEKQEEPEDIKPTESAEPAETEEPDEAALTRDEPSIAEKPSARAAAGSEAKAKAAAEAESEAGAEAEAEEADGEEGEEGEEAGGAAEDTTDGPVFEASDRRAKIIADSSGVRLRLDDQECEFTWDEIGAIETESPLFGKRFTITVHTPDRRWYFLEIEAKAKSEHAAWEKQIDEVLDAYFDDGSDDAAAEEEPEDTAP